MKKKQEKKQLSIKDVLKSVWNYIWKSDSIGSYVLNFFLAFIIIKYIFFPGVGFLLNSEYPIVAVVSGSMEHKVIDGRVCDTNLGQGINQNLDFDSWWDYCGAYYVTNFNISKSEFRDFKFSSGLNTGDVIILYGRNPKEIKVGEVLVFIPEQREFYLSKGPVIHRVMNTWESDGVVYFQTKGDHNPRSFEGFEHRIPEDDVFGVGVVKIPYLGYPKLLLNYLFNIG